MCEARQPQVIREMLDVRQTQYEIDIWANRNFGVQAAYRPLLGVAEEIGELCHAQLKMEQGIRGMNESAWRAKVIDAVGDIFVFLSAYCSTIGVDLEEAIQVTWEEVRQRDWSRDPENGGRGVAKH